MVLTACVATPPLCMCMTVCSALCCCSPRVSCRAALLSDLSSKDDVVREMQGACDHLQHQLNIALNDRNLLMEQLRTLAGGRWGCVLRSGLGCGVVPG